MIATEDKTLLRLTMALRKKRNRINLAKLRLVESPRVRAFSVRLDSKRQKLIGGIFATPQKADELFARVGVSRNVVELVR